MLPNNITHEFWNRQSIACQYIIDSMICIFAFIRMVKIGSLVLFYVRLVMSRLISSHSDHLRFSSVCSFSSSLMFFVSFLCLLPPNHHLLSPQIDRKWYIQYTQLCTVNVIFDYWFDCCRLRCNEWKLIFATSPYK